MTPKFIFATLMFGFIGAILLGLAGCASDRDFYDDDHNWRERAFSRHTGSGK